jgi:hypothetical protein
MSNKKTNKNESGTKFDSADVHVPAPDFRMPEKSQAIYLKAQEDLRAAIAALGIEHGVSAFVSGFSRELRRHLSVEAIQDVLNGLAESMPEAAKYDAPDLSGGPVTKDKAKSKIEDFLRGSVFSKTRK